LELLEGKELRMAILESYSRNPKGWSFVVSPAKSGFFDATVSGPEGTWMLKIDSLFKPFPIVIGSSSKEGSRTPGMPFPYGYRTLPPDLALQLVEGQGPRPRGRTFRGLLSVLRSEPVVPQEGRSYAEGPLLLAGQRDVTLSESQNEIGAKLASEMRRLLRLRYPAYG
jgi:hypothetical protein